MTDHPLLSVCMIVKDEEDLLAKSLESVSDLADEIIVVDTGSTDNTVQIALQYGAKVYHHSWQGHFGKARNHAFTKATGEWIMILDADEFIPIEFKDRLKSLLIRGLVESIEGVIIQIKNYYGNSVNYNYIFDSACRIFRNRPTYLFTSPIHEEMSQVILQKKPGAKIITTDLHIEHLGYLNNIIQKKEKNERNLTIILDELKQRPEDPFLNYACGTEYFQREKFQLALEYYLQIPVSEYAHLSFGADLIYKISVSYLLLAEYQSGHEYVIKGLEIFPDFQALWFIKGELDYMQDQLQSAKSAYQKCLQLKNNSVKYLQINGLSSFRSLWALGRVCEKEGNVEEAAVQYCLAYNSNPQYKRSIRSLLRLIRIQKKTIIDYLDFGSVMDSYDPIYDLFKEWLLRSGSYEKN